MGWFTTKKVEEIEKKSVAFIQWEKVTDISEAKDFIEQNEKIIVFFKHSTTCSISRMALDRFEKKWQLSNKKIIPVYLDIWQHREVSNFLAAYFSIRHESPQVLVIKNGKCIYNASHGSISFTDIEKLVA